MVEKTTYHICITNSQDFVNKIRSMRVEEDEVLLCHFTSVQVDRPGDVINLKLEQDIILSDRTKMTVTVTTSTSSKCLETTCFTHEGILCRQIHGATMVHQFCQ